MLDSSVPQGEQLCAAMPDRRCATRWLASSFDRFAVRTGIYSRCVVESPMYVIDGTVAMLFEAKSALDTIRAFLLWW